MLLACEGRGEVWGEEGGCLREERKGGGGRGFRGKGEEEGMEKGGDEGVQGWKDNAAETAQVQVCVCICKSRIEEQQSCLLFPALGVCLYNDPIPYKTGWSIQHQRLQTAL